MKCFLFRHDWSAWERHYSNNRVWVHEKTLTRFCGRCGEHETKIIELDCTQYRRGRGWCGSCARNIAENPRLALFVSLLYSTDMDKKIPGRKPNLAMIEKVQSLRSQGMTFRVICEMLGQDIKKVHFWAHYPLDKAKERNGVVNA